MAEEKPTNLETSLAILIFLMLLCFALGGCIFGVRSNRLAKEYKVFTKAFKKPTFTTDTISEEDYNKILKEDKKIKAGKWLMGTGGILFAIFAIIALFTSDPEYKNNDS